MTREKNEVIGNYEVVDGVLTTRREVLVMGALAAGALTGTAALAQNVKTAAAGAPAVDKGEIKEMDFSGLLTKKMEGLSSNQIDQHLKLYKGYVTKHKEITALLDNPDLTAQLPAPNATYAPLRELLIEQSFALNGVVYHELYFGNLGGEGGDPKGNLKSAIEAHFGSSAKFMDFLKASGKCMRGWVIVGWNTRDQRIHTYGLDMHNMWSPAGVIPLVVLDVYEHAYMIDHGINRAAYLDAFVKNLDWDVCGKRFDAIAKA